MKHIEMFCDGSSLGNPGAGGYCAILRYQNQEKIITGGAPTPLTTAWNLARSMPGSKP